MDTDKIYRDHTISLSGDWKWFTVKGPLFDTERLGRGMTYSSLNYAQEAVDERILADAKQKKSEHTVSIALLDSEGVNVTARGVHAVQGTLLGVGDSRDVYPVHPVVRAKLVERAQLQKQINELDKSLGPCRISGRRTFGRTKPQDYDSLITKLEEEVEQRTARAKADLGE